jgi:hypothetical protein
MQGDNYVISQQTAKACLKYTANPIDLPPSAEYLQSDPSSLLTSSEVDWKDSTVQIKLLEARAQGAIKKLGTLIQKGVPWNDLNMECVVVSRAHIETFVLRTFLTTISAAESTLQVSLTKLKNLVCVHLALLTIVRSSYP